MKVVATMNRLRLLPYVLTLMGVTSLFAPSELKAIDIKVENASVSSVVQLLRTQKCAAISFIEAAQPGTVSLNFERATVSEILSEIVRQDPAYRSETIRGRDVLYPAVPEFQAVVGDVDIQSQPRQAATELYVHLLRNAVPAFSDLVPPVLFGDNRMQIYSDKVTLRPKGRVIEHFVDLLGKDQGLYFEFIEARSGAPSLDFDDVPCTPSPKQALPGRIDTSTLSAEQLKMGRLAVLGTDGRVSVVSGDRVWAAMPLRPHVQSSVTSSKRRPVALAA
jgi:hypothetical protein